MPVHNHLAFRQLGPNQTKVTLLHTSRTIPWGTWRKEAIASLRETLCDKEPVRYKDPRRDAEYGWVSGYNSNREPFVKFAWNLLAFLDQPAPWASTTGKLCDRSRITYLNKENPSQ